MTPATEIVLTIVRGGERIYEKEGYYNIWTFTKGCGLAVSIHDAVEDKVIFEELPIGSMVVNAPFVYIQTEKD